jgi:tetratricopeptide (TPR) repeat protein
MNLSKRIIPIFLAVPFVLAMFAPAQSERPPVPPSDGPIRVTPPSPEQSVEIGDFYFRKHDYPGAISRYREAMKSDPTFAPAYLGEAKCYDRTGLVKLALADYKKYLDLLPSAKEAKEAHAVHVAIDRLQLKLTLQAQSAHSSK